jgi:NAD(P)-dependent dehydrogenase (short-subunit alcohol dehydrogenase family)
MTDRGALVVVGGTRAIGYELAKHYAERGHEVIITGRHQEQVDAAAASMPGSRGIAFDLAEPKAIASALADVGPVRRLVLAAIDRDENAIGSYDIDQALYLVTLKLVGYAAVVSALHDRLRRDGSVVLFGGMAKERPYPGSTTVSTVNGGVTGLTRSLVEELRPIRVNAIHPGRVSDTPYWAGKSAILERFAAETPLGRLPTMAEVVDATVFLLENTAVNGVDLIVDCGWHTR